MTSEQLFKNITSVGGEITYPFIYDDKDYDYLDFVAYLTSKYLAQIDQLDKDSINALNGSLPPNLVHFPLSRPLSLLEDVHAVADKVNEVLSLSYKTHHSEAYHELLDFFHKENDHFFMLLPQLEMKGMDFFRMRNSNIKWDNAQGEMFHIPFQSRHLVSTQRYSIPGYPVIYLASALETAWYELGQPELFDTTCAKYKFKDLAVFVDLGYPLKENPSLWELYSLFVFYPLIIATSVRVKYPNAPFKVEYMLPQLMLRVIRNYDHITGISYMSNKTPLQDNIFSLYYRNFVVITKNALCRDGYDADLASKMQMTKPFRFEKKWFEEHGFENSSNIAKVGLCSLQHMNDKYEDIILPMKK